ncbi:hypothetical protein AB0H00_30755 [Nocardia sp. NPDC023852]|uniref:relaxase/mobilization nuclease domain-containing protein n=1 Tax=Nocardia sp. NPDC023852 TaxID=3154697 RepID=UPI0033FFC9A9
MIPKIRRGQKLGGLVVYLLGKGDHNEHKDRHIIAGSPTVMREMWLEHFDGLGDDVTAAAREVALAVADEIEIPRRLYGTQVRMKAKPVAVGVGGRELGLDVIEPAGKGEKGQYRDAPVWHCALSLMPGEELSDDRWQQIADEFMERMGFTGTPDGKRAQARWVAVRHGLSGENGEGQDHIHIAASLVREDGSKVSTYDYGPGKAKGDWRRADEICGELEREFGLKVLASRKEGGGLSENSRAEIERAKRLGTAETERERLRRMVRAHAVAAESETEFVTGLREAGISVRARYAPGGTTEVTGYSVRLKRGDSEIGPWVGGGKLAGDLSLTALREQQWDDSPEARADALAAWKNRTSGQAGRTREGGVGAWQRAATEAEQWRSRLADVPHGDRAQWAWLAGQAAGVFAAWSETLEGDQPGAFAAAQLELTRSAQLARRTDRWRPPPEHRPSAFGELAQLLLAHPAGSRPRTHTSRGARDGEAIAEMAVLLLALMLMLLLLAIAIAVQVARAHRARGELARATAVEQMTREHLDPVRASWESELQSRRDQWDRDAAQVFTAAAGRAAHRVIDRQTAVRLRPPSQERREQHNHEQQQNREWADKVLAAASGPLTPPMPAAADKSRRKYYSELTDEEKSRLRMMSVVNAQSASRDLKPRGWTDELLAAELAHRRTEVELLAADIADRQAGGGPHMRQVLADNAELSKQAEKIVPAQQARTAAEEILAEHQRLATRKQNLQWQLEETPGRRMLARKKLHTQITETEGALEDLAPKLTAAETAAKAAAKATGVPVHEWDATLRQAHEQQQQWRLRGARAKDQRDLDEDISHLRGLQRDLDGVEAEHARREQLTPEQREREIQIRTQSKPRTTRRTIQSPEPGRGASMPYQPPDLGRDRGRDHGPSL